MAQYVKFTLIQGGKFKVRMKSKVNVANFPNLVEWWCGVKMNGDITAWQTGRCNLYFKLNFNPDTTQKSDGLECEV